MRDFLDHVPLVHGRIMSQTGTHFAADTAEGAWDWSCEIRRALARSKERRALALRRSGMTLTEVGHALGLSRERARQMIASAERGREVSSFAAYVRRHRG